MADKVIIFIEVDDETKLKQTVFQIQELVDACPINFKNALINSNNIKELINYSEKNSLLLYPYESKKNPFLNLEVKKRLDNKKEYLFSLPFINPSESFFLDPLMMGAEVLKMANENK